VAAREGGEVIDFSKTLAANLAMDRKVAS